MGDLVATYSLSNNLGIGIYNPGEGEAIHCEADGDTIHYGYFRGEEVDYGEALIEYDGDRPYFRFGDLKIYLDECIRTNY